MRRVRRGKCHFRAPPLSPRRRARALNRPRTTPPPDHRPTGRIPFSNDRWRGETKKSRSMPVFSLSLSLSLRRAYHDYICLFLSLSLSLSTDRSRPFFLYTSSPHKEPELKAYTTQSLPHIHNILSIYLSNLEAVQSESFCRKPENILSKVY